MKRRWATLLVAVALVISSARMPAAADPWDGAANGGNGWKYLAWFGSFQDVGSGWIWHAEHGWLYVSGTSPSSLWLWSSRLGWLWTSDSVYPFLYRSDTVAWLYYYRNTGNGAGGWFYEFGNGQTRWL